MKFIGLPIAALVVITLAHLGVTNTLGAHHFWSVKVAWIGVPIGLVLALILLLVSWPLNLAISLIGTLTALATAHYGKVQFAASYAEDQLAGKLWYFGWIATAALATALIAAIIGYLISRRS